MTQTESPVRGRPRMRGALGHKATPYLFMLPAAAYLIIFQGIPLIREFYLSFTKTSLLSPHINEWVGLRNYEVLLADPQFRSTLGNTLVYVAGSVVLALLVGLLTALLLNTDFRGRAIVRSLITIPWAAPAVAVALITTWMLNAQYGVISRLLVAIGLDIPSGVLDSPEWAMPAILATTVWSLFPFTSVVILAALQSVSVDAKEAAVMDGASPLWVFRVVTWPTIRPTVGMLAVLLSIWSIRRFELIWLMTQGGPVNSTNTLVIDLYARAFVQNDLGKAAAVGMVGVVISLFVVGVYVWISNTTEKESMR